MTQPINVLYKDAFLTVIYKPAGILVIPTPKKEKHTLVELVNSLVFPGAGIKWHPCHRLDRDTSGAILFASGKKNQRVMMDEFRKHAVRKKYIAFVKGKLRHKQGEIKDKIQDFHQKRFGSFKAAKTAITKYRVLSVKKYFTVVEVVPLTGRTNQIRIHFSKRGHPLLGERLYAFGKDFRVKFRRLALHASELSWRHPFLKKEITVKALLPKDMHDFLGKYT